MRAPLALSLVLCSSLHAQALRLPVLADATTDQSMQSSNFGSSTELALGKNFVSSPTFQVWFMRGHVLVDLSAAANSGRTPVRATFHWYQSRASAAGCLSVNLHRVLQPWNESTITWQNQPAHDPAVVASACVGANTGTGWKQFDVTALVQSWLDGTHPNYGFVIRDPSESTAGAARPGFGHSRENGNPGFDPYLDVEFADRFGFGCSMRALLPMSDVVAGTTRLGDAFTLRTSSLIPGSVVGVLFGLSNTNWTGGALPWSLAPLGFPGCALYVSPDIAATFPAVASGDFDLRVPLPSAPALAGSSFFMQAIALPAGLGLEVGNGVGVTLR